MTAGLTRWPRGLAHGLKRTLSYALAGSVLVTALVLTGSGVLAENVKGNARTQVVLMPGEDPGSIAEDVQILDVAGLFDADGIQPDEELGILFDRMQGMGAGDISFRLNTGSIVNPGAVRGNVWLRLDLKNEGDRLGRWVFSFNRVLLNNVGLYLVSDGKLKTLIEGSPEDMTGSYRRYRTIASEILLPPQAEAFLLIRYQGANWSGLSPVLATEETIRRGVSRNLAVFLILLGGITTLVVFGSVSFVFLGRQVVLFYALAQMAFFAFYAHFSGITTVYLWPDMAQSFRLVAPVTMSVFILAITQFARQFFDTKGLVPRLDRFLVVCLWLALAGLVLLPMHYLFPGFDRRIALLLVYLVSALCWIALPVLSVYATLNWHRDFWPMVLAWGITGFFVLSLQLIWLGAISGMPLQQNAYGVVVYIEALFLALAISLRIRVLRAATLEAEQKSSESLRLQLQETERARKLAEEREWALQDLAEKGRLLLTTGHDTRQMLSALRNYSAALRSSSEENRVHQASHRIDEIADHLNEVLTVAVEGSRSGGMTDETLALDTLSSSKVFDPLLLIHSAAARERNIEIRIFTPDRPLVTDRVLVGRILGNLVSNAVKATEDGKILLAHRPGKTGCRLQVWDTGKGIDEEGLATLLDPETRSLRLDEEAEGTGTGFTIAKALARRLGGSIEGRSEPGRGSMFELVLPEVQLQASPSNSMGTDVLLVDGDPQHVDLFSRVADDLGLRLHVFETTEAVENHLQSKEGGRPIVILDEHLGGSQRGADWVCDFSSRQEQGSCVLMTFDRSVEARTRLTNASSMLLYRPLSERAIRMALVTILNQRGAN